MTGAVLAGAAAVLHFYDRFAARGFYRATRDMATANAKAIHTSLEALRTTFEVEDGSEAVPGLKTLQDAFTGLPGAITQAVSAGIVDASTKVMQAQLAGEPQVPPGVQAMGTDSARDRALTKSLKMAVGADMLGPYGGILSEFAPTVFAWLQEHPDSVQWALSQPWLQGLIKKASAFIARGQGGPSPFEGKNPFLTE